MSDCLHPAVSTWTSTDGTVSMWACSDCRQRFYPACSICVDVGHRNVEHSPAPPSEGLDGFVKRLYDLGVVDKTVTAENVMSVLQRAADKGKLTVETVVRAALPPADPSAGS